VIYAPFISFFWAKCQQLTHFYWLWVIFKIRLSCHHQGIFTRRISWKSHTCWIFYGSIRSL